MAAVKYAYQVASSHGDMSVDWLEAHFQADKHPRVRTRDKTAERVFVEFSNGIRSKTTGVVSED